MMEYCSSMVQTENRCRLNSDVSMNSVGLRRCFDKKNHPSDNYRLANFWSAKPDFQSGGVSLPVPPADAGGAGSAAMAHARIQVIAAELRPMLSRRRTT